MVPIRASRPWDRRRGTVGVGRRARGMEGVGALRVAPMGHWLTIKFLGKRMTRIKSERGDSDVMVWGLIFFHSPSPSVPTVRAVEVERERERTTADCEYLDPVKGLISVHVQRQIFCLLLFASFGGLCFTVLHVLMSLLRILADIGTEW